METPGSKRVGTGQVPTFEWPGCFLCRCDAPETTGPPSCDQAGLGSARPRLTRRLMKADSACSRRSASDRTHSYSPSESQMWTWRRRVRNMVLCSPPDLDVARLPLVSQTISSRGSDLPRALRPEATTPGSTTPTTEANTLSAPGDLGCRPGLNAVPWLVGPWRIRAVASEIPVRFTLHLDAGLDDSSNSDPQRHSIVNVGGTVDIASSRATRRPLLKLRRRPICPN